MKNHFLALCIFLGIISGCKGNLSRYKRQLIEEDGKRHEVLYDKKTGNIISKYEINEEENKHGECLEFYPNGKLKTTKFYNNGILEGAQYTYFDDDTVSFFYFDTGLNDTMKYKSLPVKFYEIYYDSGTLIFKREYDNKGVLLYEEGYAIIISRVNKKKLKKNEELKGQIYLASPPYTIRSVELKTYFEGKEIAIDSLSIDPAYNAAFYVKKFEKQGDYKICITSKFEEFLCDTTLYDSYTFPIEVFDN